MDSATLGIDLATLDTRQDALHDVPVLFDEDGTALAGFKVVDANSKRYRDAKRKFDLINVKRSAVRRKAIDAKTDEGAAALLDLAAEQRTDIAVECVVEWYGFKSGGVDVPPTPETLAKVFAAYPQWVELVNAKIAEGASFLSSSPTSSATSPGTSSV